MHIKLEKFLKIVLWGVQLWDMDQIIDHGLFYMGIVGVKLYTNCTNVYEILNICLIYSYFTQ